MNWNFQSSDLQFTFSLIPKALVSRTGLHAQVQASQNAHTILNGHQYDVSVHQVFGAVQSAGSLSIQEASTVDPHQNRKRSDLLRFQVRNVNVQFETIFVSNSPKRYQFRLRAMWWIGGGIQDAIVVIGPRLRLGKPQLANWWLGKRDAWIMRADVSIERKSS